MPWVENSVATDYALALVCHQMTASLLYSVVVLACPGEFTRFQPELSLILSLALGSAASTFNVISIKCSEFYQFPVLFCIRQQIHHFEFLFLVREQLKELTKQYDKSEDDLKALQSVGQVKDALPSLYLRFAALLIA